MLASGARCFLVASCHNQRHFQHCPAWHLRLPPSVFFFFSSEQLLEEICEKTVETNYGRLNVIFFIATRYYYTGWAAQNAWMISSQIGKCSHRLISCCRVWVYVSSSRVLFSWHAAFLIRTPCRSRCHCYCCSALALPHSSAPFESSQSKRSVASLTKQLTAVTHVWTNIQMYIHTYMCVCVSYRCCWLPLESWKPHFIVLSIEWQWMNESALE